MKKYHTSVKIFHYEWNHVHKSLNKTIKKYFIMLLKLYINFQIKKIIRTNSIMKNRITA